MTMTMTTGTSQGGEGDKEKERDADAHSSTNVADAPVPSETVKQGNVVSLQARKSIQEYLKWDCSAITFHTKYPDGNIRLTPVALDGASGVGKTQQAFALLKKRKAIVYVLMVSTNEKSQEIYKEMVELQANASLLMKITVAIEALRIQAADAGKESAAAMVAEEAPKNDATSAATTSIVNATEQSNSSAATATPKKLASHQTAATATVDYLSEGFIKQYLNMDEVKEVAVHLFEYCIGYVEGSEAFHYPHSGLEYNVDLLKDKVLFLDEALPKSHSKDHLDRLQFMRNLACDLQMQVVAAGTQLEFFWRVFERCPIYRCHD